MHPTKRRVHPTCTNRFEKEITREGYSRIAGVDEVGRGALCGPVLAAAVVLDPQRIPEGIDDSKKLSSAQREVLFQQIVATALAVGVGRVEPEIIDRENILQATLRAMGYAVTELRPPADFLLIDAVRLPSLNLPQRSIIKGDAQSVSIAAASIVAKVTRDRIMVELDRCFPEYFLEKNKGYGTQAHLESLRRYGPSPIHRKTFRPVMQGTFSFE